MLDTGGILWYNGEEFKQGGTEMGIGIAGLQKLTLLDFPGRVACTVFLGGCNLRCPFCHNASLVVPHGEMPHMDENAFFDFLKKRQGVLDGVCVTGGEPLLYPELGAFLAKIRAMGFLVKLDTNGTLPDRLAPLLSAGTVDYVAMDVKHAPSKYPTAVGVDVDTERVAESMSLIKASGVAHEFRTTLVKGLHTEADVAEMARAVGDSAYFLQGFIDSGDLIDGADLSAFDKEEMTALCETAKKYAPQCRVRGV